MEGYSIRISDIARKAGVSSATVSRVINDSAYVVPATRRKVERSMHALHYRPNLVARSLVTRESRTIGLMIPHIRSPFFAGLASGVEERAEELGYAVFLCDTRESTECERRVLEVLASRRVDGIIATPVGRESRYFTEITSSIPVVFAARHFPEVPISSVVVDNAAGSRRIIQHLLDIGHRRIGVINGPYFLSTGLERWAGVRQTFDEFGVDLDPKLVKEGDFTAQGGYQLARVLLQRSPRPTALYAANHMMLAGCIRAVSEKGLLIPDDMVVSGFEGFRDTGFDYMVSVPITVNEHPTHEMAVSAVNLLMEQIQGVRGGNLGLFKRVVLKTKLVVSASTARKRSAGVKAEK